MNGHAQLAVIVGIPILILASAIKIEAWNDERQAQAEVAAAHEDDIVRALEDLGVKDPHSDDEDEYRGDVGNCNTTISIQGDEATFSIAVGRQPILGGVSSQAIMEDIGTMDLNGKLTIYDVEEFDEAECFVSR